MKSNLHNEALLCVFTCAIIGYDTVRLRLRYNVVTEFNVSQLVRTKRSVTGL